MKDKEHIDFTNETMRFINKLTDEIYESLIDKEYEDLYDSTTILIEYLIKLQNERLHQVRSRVVPRGEQD
jgi:predicted house-cleaning noncanonical NTP pyrophosphatase (MazG superfamily)